MEIQAKLPEPRLWWIAGADARILAQCPRADQVFVQHLGISLIGAFLFVFLITSVSLLIAFPGLTERPIALVFAFSISFLIATMVFLIDRLFIQSDWDWQAAKQRREIARADWEAATPQVKLATRASEFGLLVRARRFLTRFMVVSFRILLSVAIGLTGLHPVLLTPT